MLRFVILDHDDPFAHFDLMLETRGVLRTWRLYGRPDSPDAIRAEPIGDHRIAYLDYEGPVGGGRGRVIRWDRGEYEWIDERADRLFLRLFGSICRGQAELAARDGEWHWLYSRDG